MEINIIPEKTFLHTNKVHTIKCLINIIPPVIEINKKILLIIDRNLPIDLFNCFLKSSLDELKNIDIISIYEREIVSKETHDYYNYYDYKEIPSDILLDDIVLYIKSNYNSQVHLSVCILTNNKIKINGELSEASIKVPKWCNINIFNFNENINASSFLYVTNQTNGSFFQISYGTHNFANIDFLFESFIDSFTNIYGYIKTRIKAHPGIRICKILGQNRIKSIEKAKNYMIGKKSINGEENILLELSVNKIFEPLTSFDQPLISVDVWYSIPSRSVETNIFTVDSMIYRRNQNKLTSMPFLIEMETIKHDINKLLTECIHLSLDNKFLESQYLLNEMFRKIREGPGGQNDENIKAILILLNDCIEIFKIPDFFIGSEFGRNILKMFISNQFLSI